MNPTQRAVDSTQVEAFLAPIEVHVFQRDNDFFIFDVRNFSVLKTDSAGAAVAERMSSKTFAQVRGELSAVFAPEVIASRYVTLLRLIQEGVLSSEPLPAPERPPYNRMVLMLAGGCNMGCAYCFEKNEPSFKKPNLMSQETADKALTWFFNHHEGQEAFVQLFGGEPTLNWSVLENVVCKLDEWARESSVLVTKYLVTNGTLLSPERIRFLKERSVVVQVSVDGNASTHNKFRTFKSGKPTYELVAANVRELSKQKVHFKLRAVVTRANTDVISIRNDLRAIGASRVSFNPVATDFEVAKLAADDWKALGASYANLLAEPFNSWTELTEDFQSMIMRIIDRNRLFYGCPAGVSEVMVDPTGAIYECQAMDGGPYSHLSENTSPVNLKANLLKTVDERAVCKECWARYLCGGGCMHQSHVVNGNDDPVSPFCEMKRGEAEAAILKICEVAQTTNA